MPSVVADAFVRILPQTAGFSSGLRRNLATGFTASEIQAQSFTRRIGSTIATGLAAAAKVGTAALAGFGAFALSATGQLEQTLISFETILGSAEEGKAFMDELFDFAARTPFEIPQLADAARRFLAVGFAADEVLVSLEAVATAGAAVGATSFNIDRVVLALGQMAGKGKVTAEELRQISDNFPGFSAIDAIATGLGVTIPEAFAEVKAGAVSADEGIQFLLDGMNAVPGAATILERQSRTLLGVFSTLKDRVRQSVFEGMRDEVAGLADAMFEFIPILGEFASGLSEGIGVAVADAVPVLTGLFEQFARFAAPATSTFFDVIFGLLEAMTPAIEMLADSADGLIETFGLLGEGAATALGVFSELLMGLVPLFEPVLNIIGTLIERVETELAPVFSGVADAVREISDVLGGTLSSMFGQLEPGIGSFLDAFGQLGVPIRDFGSAIADVLQAALPVLLQLAQNLSDVYLSLRPVILQVVDVIAQVFDQTAGLFAQLMPVVAEIMGAIIPLIGTVVEQLSPVIAAISGVISEVFKSLEPILPVIVELIKTVIGAVAPLIPVIGEVFVAFVGIIGVLVDVFGSFLEAILPVVSSILTALAPAFVAFEEIVVRVYEALAPFIEQLGGVVVDVLTALAPGFVALADAAVNLLAALEPVFSVLVDVIGDVMSVLGPFITLIAETLADVVVTLAPHLVTLAEAFAEIVEAVLPLIPVALELVTAFLEPFLDVIPTLAEIVGELATAFGEDLAEIMVQLAPVVMELLEALTPLVEVLGTALADVLVELAPMFIPLILPLTELAIDLLPVLIPLIQLFTEMLVLLLPVMQLGAFIVGLLVEALTGLMGVFRSVVGAVVSFVASFIGAILDLHVRAGEILGDIVDWFSELPGRIGGFLGQIPGIASMIWTRVKDGVRSLKDGVVTAFRTMVDLVRTIWGNIRDVVKTPLNFVIGGINTFIGGINSIAGVIPGVDLSIDRIPEIRHRGGIIGGPGSSRNGRTGKIRDDERLALLQTGEGILPREVMQKLSPRDFELIRQGRGDRTPGMGDGIGSWNPVTIVSNIAEDLKERAFDVAAGIARRLLDTGMGMLRRIPGGPSPVHDIAIGAGEKVKMGVLDWIEDLKGHMKQAGIFTPDLAPGIGWKKMYEAVLAEFPDVELLSAFREGAITATGNRSYHASGRAIDISPRNEIFEWIRSNFMAITKELIFSPMGNRQVWNGANHYYGEPTRGDHWDHIHWAMANGGFGRVTRPTHFVAGEAGPEDFAFAPVRKGGLRSAGLSGETKVAVEVNIYGSVNGVDEVRDAVYDGTTQAMHRHLDVAMRQKT